MANIQEEYNGVSRTECIRGMNQGSADSRCAYISQIGDLGATTMAILGLQEEVAKQAKDVSNKVQEQAVIAIGKMGADAKDYVMQVAHCLTSRNENVLLASCRAVGMIGEAALPCGTQVMKLTDSPDVAVSLAAVTALGKMKAVDSIPDLIKLLGSEVPGVAAAAAQSLGIIGDTAKLLPEMSKLLESQDAEKRRAGMSIVKLSGKEALMYKDKLLTCLADKDPVVRDLTVAVYGELGDDAKVLLDGTAKLLETQDGATKCAAAMALGKMGKLAGGQAKKLAALLTDGFEELESQELWKNCMIRKPPAAMRRTKCAGAMALAGIGDDGSAYAADVFKLTEDDCWEVRETALVALGSMGKAGAVFEPQVMELINDEDVAIASAALIAVGKMGESIGGSSKEVVDAVAKKLVVSSPVIRTHAARALSYMGLEVAGQMEALLKCFTDRCPKVKIAAMEAVARSGPIGTLLAPRIANMMGDNHAKVRAAAASVLPLLGERGAALADDVATRFEDPDAAVRAAAVTAIGAFCSQTDPSQMSYLLDAIASMQNDSSESVQIAASQVLAATAITN